MTDAATRGPEAGIAIVPKAKSALMVRARAGIATAQEATEGGQMTAVGGALRVVKEAETADEKEAKDEETTTRVRVGTASSEVGPVATKAEQAADATKVKSQMAVGKKKAEAREKTKVRIRSHEVRH